jgi:hypothetical protein
LDICSYETDAQLNHARLGGSDFANSNGIDLRNEHYPTKIPGMQSRTPVTACQIV